ncbi:Scarecrow-like protein 32 [Striga hermonthica]|uniref:Scarecrow-like protein 32 n=1 Tax=Striga hermonthica TaxID=68872 RepID=A0A9N7P0C5_STRHE|nr:Scarecrow-like protein 32 [Striga hermonthica]
MQFTENNPSSFIPIPLPTNQNQAATFLGRARPWPGLPTPKPSIPNCMEQLLVHCATAVDRNDTTLAQQILWVLNNIAPPDGGPTQRLASAFLRALTARAGGPNLLAASPSPPHTFSAVELAAFVDLTPWHRFGFTAANAAISASTACACSSLHVVDLSTTFCMQIPTLIDALSSHPPPLLRLTVADTSRFVTPPALDLSYDELGARLVGFARSRNMAMEFTSICTRPSDGFSNLIEHLRLQQHSENKDEALVINCHMMLHYTPDETLAESGGGISCRTAFLNEIRSLNPSLVVVVDEDVDFTSNDLVRRLRSAYDYLWIHYDAVDTLLPEGSKQREWYEADVCRKIEDVVAREGTRRVERVESKGRWARRMRAAGFVEVGFGEEAVAEVKGMLEEHAAGWGLKREEDGHLVLTWKGHNAVFATAWVPA